MAGRCTRWLAAVAARRRAYRMRHEKHAPLRMMLMIPLTGKLAGYKFTSPRAVHGVLHGPSTRVVRRTDSSNWFTDILTHRMDSIKASGRNQRSAGSATAVVADGFLETQWSLLQSRRKHALFLRHRHSLRNPTGRAEPAGDLRRLDVTLRVRFRRVHRRHPFAYCSMWPTAAAFLMASQQSRQLRPHLHWLRRRRACALLTTRHIKAQSSKDRFTRSSIQIVKQLKNNLTIQYFLINYQEGLLLLIFGSTRQQLFRTQIKIIWTKW